MVTNRPIICGYGLLSKPVIIPAGTEVIYASNLPHGGYWVEQWEGFDVDNDELETHQRNIGFHVL
mgnify:CR=1 FL=1